MGSSISGKLAGEIVPLQPGMRAMLEAVNAGATPELRIGAIDNAAVTARPATAQPAAELPPGLEVPPTALSPRDLPVIMRALARMTPAPIPLAEAGRTFLRAAAAADLPPAVIDQVQRWLAPLDAALPPGQLATVLRAFLAQSGLFTENRLAALPEQPGPLTTDQRQAIGDIRVLLGALTTDGTPVPDAVRVFGELLQQQQLVVAERLAATGSGQFTVPFVFGDEHVDIRFTWDRSRDSRQERQDTHERSEPEDGRAISLSVFTNLTMFGAIEARIVAQPEAFAVSFYVERDATRAIVEAGLSDLSNELCACGFPAATTNVWLNPDRVSAGVTPARPALPAGTILDVRA